MSKPVLIFLSVFGFLTAIGFLILTLWAATHNGEVGLRNAIKAKQVANQATFDNMVKQISQVAEVTEEQTRALKDIFLGHAAARTGEGSDRAIMKWVTESVPNVDTGVYKNLQNIIVAARNSFTSDQVALLDLKREHDSMLAKFPGSLFLAGRQPMDVTIVTSSRTGQAFSSGKDDDTKVFNR